MLWALCTVSSHSNTPCPDGRTCHHDTWGRACASYCWSPQKHKLEYVCEKVGKRRNGRPIERASHSFAWKLQCWSEALALWFALALQVFYSKQWILFRIVVSVWIRADLAEQSWMTQLHLGAFALKLSSSSEWVDVLNMSCVGLGFRISCWHRFNSRSSISLPFQTGARGDLSALFASSDLC